VSETALVRCDCGWWAPQNVCIPGIPVAFALAPDVAEMIRHWRDGHRLSCQSSIRYQVRDLLKRYRQVQRAKQRGEDIVDMPRRAKPRSWGEDWT
jgi:hypothetical protein